jgi:hypothetical protein
MTGQENIMQDGKQLSQSRLHLIRRQFLAASAATSAATLGWAWHGCYGRGGGFYKRHYRRCTATSLMD